MDWLHPIVVHFAIALLSIGIVADGIYQISRNAKYGSLVLPLLLIGVFFAFLAVYTGLQAEKTVEIPSRLASHVAVHKLSALLTTGGAIITLLLRWFQEKYSYHRGIVKWGYRLIAILTLAFLFRTGLLGGEMVYKYGVGIHTTEPSTPPSQNLFETPENN